jgi:hypothetical protein
LREGYTTHTCSSLALALPCHQPQLAQPLEQGNRGEGAAQVLLELQDRRGRGGQVEVETVTSRRWTAQGGQVEMQGCSVKRLSPVEGLPQHNCDLHR